MKGTMKPAVFLVVLAVALAMAGCRGGGDDSLPVLPAEYFDGSPFGCNGITTDLDLSTEHGSGYVYEMEQKELTEDYAAELASRFGFKGTPIYNAETRSYAIQDDKAELSIQKDRNEISYRRNDLKPSAGNFPPDEEMVSEAKNQLKKWGLLPKAELRTTIETHKDVAVIEFQFADVPVTRFGVESISLSVTPQGEFWGLVYRWQEPKMPKEYPFISEQEAWERLQRCEAFVRRHSVETRFTKVRLGYEEAPFQQAPFDYFYPIYIFETDEEGIPGWAGDFAWVPAVTDEYLIPYGPGNEPKGWKRQE